MIGIEEKSKMKKVEDFSDDEEILGAYDAEWHRKEEERVVRIAQLEEAKEEGMAQGRVQGIENTAKNMLKEKTDVNFISKVTGLSIEEINKLK